GNVIRFLFTPHRSNKIVANGKSIQAGRAASKRVVGVGQRERVRKEKPSLAETIRRDLGGKIARLKASIPACRYRRCQATVITKSIPRHWCPEGSSLEQTVLIGANGGIGIPNPVKGGTRNLTEVSLAHPSRWHGETLLT